MTDKEQPIGLGFIGCGQVTTHGHLRALQSLPAARVVAVADIDEKRLQQVTKQFRVDRAYPDYSSLLQDPAVQIVAVCVPAQSHVRVALDVLDAGKHLFIEKPLALSLDDSDRLIERAALSRSQVMVGFNLRRHRLTQEALAVIREGTLGPIEAIRSVLTSDTRFQDNTPAWRKQRELGGGEFFETAVHHFDLWSFLLKTEIDEIFATSRSGKWDDETVVITARLANGALASALFSTGTGSGSELDIYGHGGRLSLAFMRFDGFELTPRSGLSGDLQSRVGGVSRVLTNLPHAVLSARKGGDFIASYRAEWRHFIDCFRRGVPPESTLQDGRRALEAVLAAAESASTGRPVKVAEAARTVAPVSPVRCEL